MDDVRVGVDAHRLVCEPSASGSTYLGTLLQVWRGRPITLYLSKAPSGPYKDLLDSYETRISKRHFDPSTSLKSLIYWTEVVLPSMVSERIFFSPFHITPLAVRGKVVTTIHDLCFLFERKHSLGRIVHKSFIYSALLRARNLICVSETTMRALQGWSARAHKRAAVVPNGIDTPTLDWMEARKLVDSLGVPDEYLLWVGSPSRRKNPELVLSASAGFPLVALSKQGSLAPGPLFLSGVSDIERDALMRCARVLLNPSECEGFGYSTLEAMRQGTVPLGLKGTAIEEITGDLVDHATTPDTLAERIRSYWDTDISDELIDRSWTFSGERMAQGTWSRITG